MSSNSTTPTPADRAERKRKLQEELNGLEAEERVERAKYEVGSTFAFLCDKNAEELRCSLKHYQEAVDAGQKAYALLYGNTENNNIESPQPATNTSDTSAKKPRKEASFNNCMCGRQSCRLCGDGTKEPMFPKKVSESIRGGIANLPKPKGGVVLERIGKIRKVDKSKSFDDAFGNGEPLKMRHL